MSIALRAGLTIEQSGQMPGASRFWGPRAYIKALVYWFFKF